MLLGDPTFGAWMATVVMTVPGGKVCKPAFLTADGESCLKVLLVLTVYLLKTCSVEPRTSSFAVFY